MQMFLHLGGNTVISIEEIIIVLNMEKIEVTEDWIKQNFLKQSIIDIADGKPKSMIFTDKEIILSPISSLTLKKRLNQIPV
jgi:ABC-type uncharacterized transport system substrate-binding protein